MVRPVRISSAAWKDPRHRLGLAGEEAAMEYLASRGWLIEAHRFRVGRQELDLVARRGALVAFIEVKTRRGDGYGTGREAIGWRKRRALGLVAEAWRLRHGRPGDTYRFDVLEVRSGRGGPGEVPLVVHLEDAWRLWR